ncbi:MAG: uroporphyrinogen decarboxylase family protein [Anaerolineales bacterium]|nr:uroporphyrinogen decarboxylase family protein [Anaerolineales bacterium]
MNGRERIALAMRHEAPDRVPVMCQLALGHYFLNAWLAPHEIWFTSEGFAEALVTMQKRYQFDGILINLPGRPRNVLDEIKSIEKTKKGELVIWRNGHVTIIPWDDNAQYVYSARPELQQRADLITIDPNHLEMIDQYPGYVWNTYHMPWLADKNGFGPMSEVPDYFLDTIDLVRAKTNGEVSVHGEVFSPFTHYLELIGYQNAIIGLVKNKEKVKALLERLTDASIAWAVAQAKRGVDAVLISSAFAGGGFISPKMYAEYVVPYERRVADAVKKLNVPVYTHTCGKIGDRLELMEQTGTMGIDTLDPHPLGNVELADAKDGVGKRLFLKGNMNSVSILEYTTKEEVVAEATERIQIGKPGSGYILSSACSIAPRVEPWKIELFTPLAEEIGRYR